jgi:hypothetical protein
MRDPHVAFLFFRRESGSQLVFNDPKPEEWDTPSFTLQLAHGRLRITMAEHAKTSKVATKGVVVKTTR